MGYRLKGLDVSDGRIRACGTERFFKWAFKLKCECCNRVQQIKEEGNPVSPFRKMVCALFAGFYLGFDFAVFRKAALLFFGEDQFSVDTELKASFVGGNQREAGDVLLVFYENLFRQTDGFVLIASGRAVDQFQSHAKPPVVVGGLRVV